MIGALRQSRAALCGVAAWVIVVTFVAAVMVISSGVSPTVTAPSRATLTMGGYSPPGTPGYGRLSASTSDEAIGWTIVDYPQADGLVEKACRYGVRPAAGEDLDFFYFEGAWRKLRGGALHLGKNGASVSPPRKTNFGVLSTPAHFPAGRPFFLYRLHIVKEKFLRGAMGPREYLLFLKTNVQGCEGIPE
ncbi:MAG: hypothetical protein AAGB02_01785 [Pseudomonadota bacterium]